MSLMYAKLQALQSKSREQDLERILGNSVTCPISQDRREQVAQLMSKLNRVQ